MSNSWAGTNNYFLHGLSPEDQDSYLDTLADLGCKVVRVWAPNCEKAYRLVQGCGEYETTIRQYDPTVLDLLDAVIIKMKDRGMKALISPHDANQLAGERIDVYGNTWGPADFYTNPDAAAAYDDRITAVVNYLGRYSGMVWKDWSDAIMGFDVQNEAFVVDQKWRDGDPALWVCKRADHLREQIGYENPIKVCSGGVGDDFAYGANYADYVVNCKSIDIVSFHYYGVDGKEAEKDFLGKAKGKLAHIEEWTTKPQSGDQVQQWADNANVCNATGIAWCFWQLLPRATCPEYDWSRDPDQSGTFIDDPSKDIGTSMRAASTIPAPPGQSWVGIIY